MTPVPIDAELLAKLTQGHGEVPLAGPDGQPVGYFLSPDQYAWVRKFMTDWAFAQVSDEDLREAFANPGQWHSMEEVFKLLEGN